MYEEIEVLKPEDWPAGQREANLEEIYNAIIRFMDSPTYTSKENLFALVTQTDLNEMDSRGVFRCTKYEVALMNTIYMYATILCCDSIKIYLYRHIAITARNHKMIYYMKEEINYLCDLIDLYSISKEEKNKILNEMLSVTENIDSCKVFPD